MALLAVGTLILGQAAPAGSVPATSSPAGEIHSAVQLADAGGCDTHSPIPWIISFPSYADTPQDVCGMSAVEAWAYEMYGDIHGYPAGDPRIAETGYPEIAGYIEGILEQISYLEANDPSVLTADELGAYDWMEAIDETFQVRAAQDAINEYNKWNAEQCSYKPPNTTLFSYDALDQAGCAPPGGGSSLGTLFAGPTPPSYQEFLNYGIYDANQTLGTANPLGNVSDEQVIEDGITAGIGGAMAVLGGAAPQILNAVGVGDSSFTDFLRAALPNQAKTLKRAQIRNKRLLQTKQNAKVNATEDELEAKGAPDEDLVSLEEGEGINFQDAGVDAAAEAAAEGADALSGPVAIAALAVTAAVMEGINVITAAEIPAQLQTNLTNAQQAQAASEVENLLDDPTGAGYAIDLADFEAQLNLPSITIGNPASGSCSNCVVYNSPPTPSSGGGEAIQVTALDAQGNPTNWTWTAQTVGNIDTWPLGVDDGWNGPPEESISVQDGVVWAKQQAGYQATDATADGLQGYLPSGELNYFDAAGHPERAFVDGNQFATLTSTGSVDAGGEDYGDNCATAGECTLSNSIVVTGLGGTAQLQDHLQPTTFLGITCSANDPGTPDCFSDNLEPDGSLVPAEGQSVYATQTGNVTQKGTGQLFRLTLVPDAGTPASIYPVTNQYNALANDKLGGAPNGGFVAGQTATFTDWATNALGYSTSYEWQIETKCAYNASQQPENVQGVPVCAGSPDYGHSSLAPDEQDLISCASGSPPTCLRWTEDAAFHNDPVTTLTGPTVNFTWPAPGTYHVRLITTDQYGQTNLADEDIPVANPSVPSTTLSVAAASGTHPSFTYSAFGPVVDGDPVTLSGCVQSADFQGSTAYSTPRVTVNWGDGTTDSATAGSSSDPNLSFTYQPSSGCSTPWAWSATHTYDVTVSAGLAFTQDPVQVTVADVTDPVTTTPVPANSAGTSTTVDLAANIYAPTSPPSFADGAAHTVTGTAGGALDYTGYVSSNPAPTSISEAGASGQTQFGASCIAGLPPGTGFVSTTNTFTIDGTTNVNDPGCYAVTVTAANANGSASETLVMDLQSAPAITSASSTGFTTGSPGSFTVATTGFPSPSLSLSGASLPADLRFVDNGDGTATLSSNGADIAATDTGTYTFTIDAASAAGSTTQSFTLTIGGKPIFTGGTTAGLKLQQDGSITVGTTGYPAATSISCTTKVSGSVVACNGSAAYACANSYVDNSSPGNPVSGDGLLLEDSSGAIPATCNGSSTVSGSSALLSGFSYNPGEYDVTLTATNAVGSTTETLSIYVSASGGPTLDFVHAGNLTQYTAPSGPAPALGQATFVVGAPGSLTVCSNDAGDVLSPNFALPAGLSVANGASTANCPSDANAEAATISGTPSSSLAANSTGTYNSTSTGSVVDSGGGMARLNIVLWAASASTMAITSPSTATFHEGQSGSFTVDLGTRTPTGGAGCLAESGPLPARLTFTDNHDNTATISGTPAVSGQSTVTITPSDCAGTNGVAQTLTVDVDQAPTFTSATTAGFSVGAGGTFTVTTDGYPPPALTATGLPNGVSFTDNGDGTGTLTISPGAPATTTAATVALSATSASGTATQNLSLAIGAAPAFTSPTDATATFVEGNAATYSFQTTGEPTPSLRCTIGGATCSAANLPAGLTFTDNGDGTATLAGTPTATESGAVLTVAATNGIASPTATLTLNVDTAPTFAGTSTTGSCAAPSPSTTDTFPAAGPAGTWTLCGSGAPAPTMTLTSVTCGTTSTTLPSGLTFTDNGDGTATLTGIPANGSGAACPSGYTLDVALANGAATVAQALTLSVKDAIVPTSAPDQATFVAGLPDVYTMTASAVPTASFAVDPSTPLSAYPWLTFTDQGNGAATIAGTPPAAAAGTTVNLVVDETNGGAASPVAEPVTITVAPFSITSTLPGPDSLPTADLGEAYSYSFNASSAATFALASGTALPSGLSVSSSGTISGTPTEMGRFTVALTITVGATTVTTSPMVLVVGAAAHSLEISQFRSFGPGGLSDWFVQVYNTTAVSIPLTGWSIGVLPLASSCTSSCTPSFVSLGSGVLAPGATAVVSGPSYSLQSRFATSALGPSMVDLPGGFEVLAPDGTVVDVAGESGAPAGFYAGTGASFPASLKASDQDAFVRHGLASGEPVDTDDNASDFTYGPVSLPGAPTTVSAASATTTFSSSAQQVSLFATVTSASGPVNEGTVTFTLLSGSKTVGAANTSGTVSDGAASVNYPVPGDTPAGTYTIDAVYNPGPDYAASSDTSQRLTISSAATTTSLQSSANPSVAGRRVTFTATVSGASPTGPVTFRDGTVTIGTATLADGHAGFTTTALAVGKHSITASYGGDASHNPSDSAPVVEVVHAAPAAGAAVAYTPDAGGYWIVGPDGSVRAFGDAQLFGSMAGRPLDAPMVGITATGDGGGYWLVASDGGVFAFGDAAFYGSSGGLRLNAPIVGMAATPDGGGYWLVASDGGVFAFGDAAFYGSTGGLSLKAPIVGMASTPDGGGYWLVASDGGVFAFGDAVFHGSLGSLVLNKPIVGLTPSPDGGGYWLVASDGGVFTFGDAPYYGSTGGSPPPLPVIGLVLSPSGMGYRIVEADGASVSFGS